MTQHFLKSYTELLIKTCHKRGVHAMGGMVCEKFSLAAIIQFFCLNTFSTTYQIL